jgi:hypothetical protein
MTGQQLFPQDLELQLGQQVANRQVSDPGQSHPGPRASSLRCYDVVTSKGLCHGEEGADALLAVFSGEDGVEDAVH